MVVEGSNQLVIDQAKLAWSAACHLVRKHKPDPRFEVPKRSVLESMEILRENKVSPWIWAGWRLAWMQETSAHVHFKTVFADKTVKKFVSFCQENADDCRNSLVVLKEARVVQEKRQFWFEELRTSNVQTAREVATLLKSPARLYSHSLERLDRVYSDFRQRESHRLANGFWVWSRSP